MKSKIPMTLSGIKKLRKELQELKEITRPRIISDISDARSYGDLKENAEYHAAREEQGFCEGRIKEIESKLANAEIIDITKVPHNGTVIFGVTVTVMNMHTKKKSTYGIVGNDEANFKKKLISIDSPMARGLLGKKERDIAVIKTPGGKIQYEILKIDYV
ncbi:transcription elongation factor GreA [Buchnera aphidicola (Pemphigus obesinymphae)]|uniref:transcription elongation factor GreA n=1 Tax=Buchnera aphidicola TaxID=9 RepID=UPI0022384FD9|nr:transcription elongation factor GreA [Buchnera aphidicola]MCW5196676.1 transcription elongation factor GreA [Buchnera aphidicola (Pemphigus obesinymphae)]